MRDHFQNDFTSHSHEVRRITWACLLINLGLSVIKFMGGLFGASRAVVADAVHSISDASTDIAILIGVKYWSSPADESHPYGHRRIEAVITGFISFVLAAVALGIAYNAITTMTERHAGPPRWIAFAVAVVSIIVKELLYRWNVAVGRRLKSSALIANAWHHRSDSFSSIPAALAVLGARLLPDWPFLDHIGAIIVSVFILQASWRVGRLAFSELIDTGASTEVVRNIERVALGIEGVKLVHKVRTRYIGPGLFADLHVQVDGAMSVKDGHDISERVKQRLLERGSDLIDVVVHLEPYDGAESTIMPSP